MAALPRDAVEVNDHFTADVDTPEDARRLGIRLPPEKQDQQQDQGGTPRYENNR